MEIVSELYVLISYNVQEISRENERVTILRALYRKEYARTRHAILQSTATIMHSSRVFKIRCYVVDVIPHALLKWFRKKLLRDIGATTHALLA